jgi:hypothetical protein
MAEPEQTIQDASQEPGAEVQTEVKIDITEFESLKKMLEDSKKEIAGLNRKISEDEKLIKQKELEKLQGVERERAEIEMLKAEKERIEKEARDIARSRIVDKALFEANIPQEFSKYIGSQDETDIINDVKQFNDYINKIVEDRVSKTVNEKLSGKPPVGGQTVVTNDLQSQYDKAKADRNFALQNSIVRQAAKEGIKLIQ